MKLGGSWTSKWPRQTVVTLVRAQIYQQVQLTMALEAFSGEPHRRAAVTPAGLFLD